MQFPLTVPGSLAQHASKEAHCIAHNCVRLGRSHRSTDLEEGFGGPFWRKISCVCVTCGLSGVKKRTSGRHHSNQVGIIATDRRYTLMVCSLSLSLKIFPLFHTLSRFFTSSFLSLSLSKKVGILRHPSQYSHFFTSPPLSLSLKIFPLFHLLSRFFTTTSTSTSSLSLQNLG